MEQSQRYIAIGQITSAHGLTGAVKVWPLSDVDRRFAKLKRAWLGDEHREVSVTYLGRKEPLVLLEIDGVTTREAAEALKGQYLRVPVDEVPPSQPGNPYIFELIGQPVVDTQGKELGEVKGVEEGARNNLLVVRTPDGVLRRVPIVDAFVKRLEATPPVIVDPIPGLLNDVD